MAVAPCKTLIDSKGRELIEHGTPLFPAAFYHDELIREAVPWHWHDELEAVIVEKGSTLVAAGGEKFVVHQGNGFFINAGILHACWDHDQSDCRYHSIVFHPRLVGGSIDSVFWQNYIQPLTNDSSLESVQLHADVPWEKEALMGIEAAWQSGVREEAGYEFTVRALLSKLIFCLCSQHPSAISRPSDKALRDGERIKLMLQFVQEHYSEELSIADIASSAMISQSEGLRCFRATIGASPVQYLRQLRVQKAAELLKAGTLKITQIASQCGFQDMSYFAKTFKDMMGQTPSEYRRQGGA